MATTNHIGITLVEQSQAQKEVTVNEALTRIDALLNTGAVSRTTNTPPGSPSAGDIYIVGASPTGDWSGKAEQIAYFDQVWRFIPPNEGMSLWVSDEGKPYLYDGAAWTAGLTGSNLKQTLWVPAMQMRPSASSGSNSLTQVEISAGQPDVITLDFGSSVESYAQFSVAFPKGWNEGTISAAICWSHATTTINFGVVWGLQAVAIGNDDVMGTAFGTAQTVTDTGGTTNDLYVTAETPAITIGGTPAAGDVCFFRVYRKAADAADTLAINARLHGIQLFYTLDSLDDA